MTDLQPGPSLQDDRSPTSQRLSWHRWLRALAPPAEVLLLPGTAAHRDSVAVGGDMPVPSFDQALLAWRQWCQIHAGQRVEVHLSAAWTLAGVVPVTADKAVQSAADATNHMAAQWRHYLNLQPDALDQDWMVRSTRTPAGWLVCATPRLLVSDLMALASHHGVDVTWMGPWWMHGLRHWLRRGPASAGLQVHEPGWCLHIDMVPDAQTRLPDLSAIWLETLRCDAASNPSVAVSAVHRVALTRQGAAADACLWDDAATAQLLRGRHPAWRGRPA